MQSALIRNKLLSYKLHKNGIHIDK